MNTVYNYTKLLREVEKISHSLAISSLIFAAMLIVIAIAIALIREITRAFNIREHLFSKPFFF